MAPALSFTTISSTISTGSSTSTLNSATSSSTTSTMSTEGSTDDSSTMTSSSTTSTMSTAGSTDDSSTVTTSSTTYTMSTTGYTDDSTTGSTTVILCPPWTTRSIEASTDTTGSTETSSLTYSTSTTYSTTLLDDSTTPGSEPTSATSFTSTQDSSTSTTSSSTSTAHSTTATSDFTIPSTSSILMTTDCETLLNPSTTGIVTEQAPMNESTGHLNIFVVIGPILGVLIIAVVVVAAVCFFLKKRRNEHVVKNAAECDYVNQAMLGIDSSHGHDKAAKHTAPNVNTYIDLEDVGQDTNQGKPPVDQNIYTELGADVGSAADQGPSTYTDLSLGVSSGYQPDDEHRYSSIGGSSQEPWENENQYYNTSEDKVYYNV